MKLFFSLMALIYFLALAYLTHHLEREETPKLLKNKMSSKIFFHGTTIAGGLIDKDYIVKMQIHFIRLDTKLVFEMPENKDYRNVNRPPNDNRTPKHGKIRKFKESSRNATRPVYETVQPRPPGSMTWTLEVTVTMMRSAWNTCSDITVIMAYKLWDGITLVAKWIWDETTFLACRVWNGVALVTEWIWNGLTRLTGWIWDEITQLTEWIWNGLTRLSEWIWDGATMLARWIWKIWNGLTLITEWIWNGPRSTRKLFIPGNFVTDAAFKFYYEYLHNHVRSIQARIVAATWQDVFYLMSTVFAVNFALVAVYLILKCVVDFLRRTWQASKDRIAAPSSSPAPKKPIWRPKPKKKRRRNKNSR